MKTLNERIKSLRKEKGLTQSQLADMLSVTDKAVSKWEVGEANPDITLLPKISQIFDVTLDYLLTGKVEDEQISMDDMDPDKRIHLLIKKDDAENFHKYAYDAIPNYRIQHQTIYGSSPLRFGSTALQSINVPIWQEIIDNNADSIFNLCCDSYLATVKDSASIAVVMTEILDLVIKKCIDLDRDDFLYAIGVKYFTIGTNDPKKKNNRMITYYLPIVFDRKYESIETFNITRETFDYFFEKAEASPKAFKYLTQLEIRNQKDKFTATFLYDNILQNAIKYKKMDIVESYFSSFKVELENCRPSYDYNHTYSNTYLSNDWSVVGRLIDISDVVITRLINDGSTLLAKQMIEYNNAIIKKVKTIKSSYSVKTDHIYVVTSTEVDRLSKLNSPVLSEFDKFKLNSVKDRIIIPDILRNSRNLKQVREVLDNNYYHYYELVHDMLVTNNIKDLFKFFVDNNLTELANNLMLGETAYSKILQRAWTIFNLTRGYDKYDDYKLLILNQNNITQQGNISRYSGDLIDNPIIRNIKELKEKIYTDVEDTINAEKKAKEDEIEREKIAKGLTKDYFEGLLSKGETELFMIKLCALQDAIFMYDFHYEGEDYATRLNNHFIKMSENAPKSRNCDDGWGYMVLDDKWENETVKPAQEEIAQLRDLFYRLRISRNNISHPKKENIRELSHQDLIKCLDHVFSINSKVEV